MTLHLSDNIIAKDITMLLLGVLLIAMALEETRLHTRISLLVFGAMVITWFLSFWINNTSATAMMIPIILAVCEPVKEVRAQSAEEEAVLQMIRWRSPSIKCTKRTTTTKPAQDEKVFTNKHAENEFKALAKALCLSVAYGAYTGGMATITGTPPNLVLGNGQNESPISFTSWIVFALPLSFVTMIIGWLWLAFRFLVSSCFRRMDPEAKVAIDGVIRKRAKALGLLSFAETEVLVMFASMVMFWLFRNPPNIDGWGKIFIDEDFGIRIHTLYFSEHPFVNIASEKTYHSVLGNSVLYADPKMANGNKTAWGVSMMGGGFAMPRANQAFGQSEPIVLNVIILVVVGMVTEVMSNPATAQLFIPILRDMPLTVGINPLYLMKTTAIACSFAFMLPLAAPGTAPVFATGYLSIPDMALAGLPMKIIGIGVSMLAINTWGTKLFELDKLQDFLQDGTMVGTQMNSSLATTASDWLMGNETSPNIDSAHNVTLI
ncbi:S13A5-like protein [Mya arenaria]|uniref:S13A5-like protein n=1 Tax=Mya arenaria TaxID=6604 RepID=A0ABY7GFK4_MYAAR|nr:S13A5-like protein [Mya arenaria]